jgi:hypothetical protein
MAYLSVHSKEGICMNQFNPSQTSRLEASHENLVSWKSALAGLVLAILTFAAITALSLAFGGAGLSDGTTGTRAGIFGGVSFVIAIVLSTFVGAFFGVRVSGYGGRVGPYAQSLLVGSLVILLVLVQVASLVGIAGRAAGNVVGGAVNIAGTGAVAAGQTEVAQTLVEDSLGALSLRSSPEVVFRGVTTRLLNGNEEGAKNYLAAQAGLTPAQADQRIAAARTRIDEATVSAREATATAMQATGWSLFAVIVLGMISAILGGALAAKMGLAHSTEPLSGHRRPTGAPKKAFEV